MSPVGSHAPGEASAITPSPGNWEAGLLRLEGKLDRVIDYMGRQAEDIGTVRQRLHDHANELTALTAHNLPEKVGMLRQQHEDHELRIRPIEAAIARIAEHADAINAHAVSIQELKTDLAQRRGAMAAMRALWAFVGFVGAGGVVALFKVLGH